VLKRVLGYHELLSTRCQDTPHSFHRDYTTVFYTFVAHDLVSFGTSEDVRRHDLWGLFELNAYQ
jgi:hypothetical protein